MIAFVLVLAAPGIGTIGGVRSPLIENRPATSIPPISIRAMAKSEFFATVDGAVEDAFPLRAAAVQAVGALDYGLFHGSPNRDVIVGRGDWLFLTAEIRPTCLWHSDSILKMWDAFAAAMARDGIDARFLIVPDKHVAYPEMLPAQVSADDPCTAAERQVMRAGMKTRPTTVDLWGPVLDAPNTDDPRYFERDSHWTETGAMPAIKALIESIEPGLWASEPPIPAGPKSRLGDLSRLIGLPSREVVETFDRPGVTLSATSLPSSYIAPDGHVLREFKAVGTDAVIPGRTLIVYDSFFGIVQEDVASWFADSVWLHIDDLSRRSKVVGDLPPFDRVVVTRVERLAYLSNYEQVLHPLVDR